MLELVGRPKGRIFDGFLEKVLDVFFDGMEQEASNLQPEFN